MSAATHVSSLVIHARPERLARIRGEVEARGGEVPFADPAGKLVAVIETGSEAGISEFAGALSGIDGVLSANLVYHQIDGDDADATPVPDRHGGTP